MSKQVTDIKDRQLEEAKARLAILKAKGYEPQLVCKMTETESGRVEVVVSERGNFGRMDIGVMYTPEEFKGLAGTADVEAMFAEVSERYGALPYAATAERMEYGPQLTVFAVSKYEDEWEMDRGELADNEACCFVGTAPEYAEWGSCGFEIAGGGLLRTW